MDRREGANALKRIANNDVAHLYPAVRSERQAHAKNQSSVYVLLPQMPGDSEPIGKALIRSGQ